MKLFETLLPIVLIIVVWLFFMGILKITGLNKKRAAPPTGPVTISPRRTWIIRHIYILMGAGWGLTMFVIMSLVPALWKLFNGGQWRFSALLMPFFIWVVCGGVFFGGGMWLFFRLMIKFAKPKDDSSQL